MINPTEIELTSLSKKFDYETMSREVDGCSDIEHLRNISKGYIKLYLSTLERMTELTKI
jgi:hypothetical protein